MPDAQPADAPEGQEPEGSEGQEPEANADAPDDKGPKQYPESYVRQLRKEAAQFRNRVAELEETVQEREDADKTEQEKLSERTAAAEQRAADAELRLTRYEVAQERGLDMQAAAFLTGSSREELEHRAEELAKLLETKGSKPSTGFDGGAREPAPEKGPPEQEHNEFLLRAMGRSPQ